MSYFRNLLIVNGIVPLAVLGWDAFQGQLGANAVNNALHITGIVSLVFLILSLLITPLRTLTGWNSLIAYRRPLGLYGFAYAVVHLAIYFLWDRMASIGSTVEEIVQRRFLTVGFAALVVMAPLAVTSTNSMIRKLGGARWKLLHRLAYIAAVLAVLHYYMLVKSDVRQPLVFAAVVASLLGFRAVRHYVDLRSKASRVSQPVIAAARATTSSKAFKGDLLVANIRQETPDVRTFRLVNPLGGDVPFLHKPGQFLTLQLEIDGQKIRRSYTLASSPSQRGFVELTIKRNPHGRASNYLHTQVRAGQSIGVIGPGGKFVFDGASAGAVLLVAGGVGITPIMAMLRYLTDRGWTGSIYFVNAIRTMDDFIFEQELRTLVARFENLTIVTYLSQALIPTDDISHQTRRWMLRTGYVDAEGLRQLMPNRDNTPAYLCGPGPMIEAVRGTLREVGVTDDRIFTEEFVSRSPSSATTESFAAAPAQNSDSRQESVIGNVELNFVHSMIVASADSQLTVLEAAEAAGVEISWECRAGICGQCKVRCREGRVQMDATDALSIGEEQRGWILACQAHAISGVLQIEA